METHQLARGRPKGTGIDDSKTLAKIADMRMENADLRVTTAYKRIDHKPSDASIRRIQAKWKDSEMTLLAEAEQRKMERRKEKASYATGIGASSLANLAYGLSAAGQLRAIQNELNSPTMRAAMGIYDDPAMRTIKELYDSPTMRAAREIYNSPTMRAISELYDSPAMRAARGL